MNRGITGYSFFPSLMVLVIGFAALFMSSCAWLNSPPGQSKPTVQSAEKKQQQAESKPVENSQSKPQEEQKRTVLRLVGRIYSVNEEEKFAIVQAYRDIDDLESNVMIAQSRDRSRVNLKPTGEQMGKFFTADIKNGVPKVGDGVFSRSEEEAQYIRR